MSEGDKTQGKLGGEESRYNPALGRFPWEEKKDRQAELDDGDKYLDFVDLRLEEEERLFPEGLAGGCQGALERATNRGISASLLRREAADALIQALDEFAAGGAEGIEGTASDKWVQLRKTRSYGSGGERGDDQGSAENGVGHDKEEVLEVGDVRAAAAEAKRAVEAAQKEAVLAAAAAAINAEESSGDQGAKVLGSGPIWEEMKTLAESNRRPLKGAQKVETGPHQRSFLLTGRRGSGKSCVLNQIVLHARSTDWIVLFVPDAWNLVQKGIYCQPSPVFDKLYDLPVQSLKRLKTLRDAHADQLKDVSIKDPEVLARHAGAKNLLELLELGVDDEERAGTVHYDLMRELLATTEAKVLLAIDEYNELFQPSQWHYMDDKLEAPHLTATAPLVPPLETTVTGLTFADENLTALANPPVDKKRPVRALPCLDVDTGGKCLPPPPANGIVVCATSGRYPPVKKLKKKKKWTPFEDVAGRLATAVAVQVEPYSRREFLRVVKRYGRVEEVIPGPLTTMEMAKVHAKSDGIPEWVFDTCKAGYYRIAGPE
ncbi:unnamed protein product [Ascophyllum nodosum]